MSGYGYNMDTLLALVVLLTLLALEVFLTFRKNMWLGLVIPALMGFGSLAYMFYQSRTAMAAGAVTSSSMAGYFVILLVLNVPTVLSALIYIYGRGKYDQMQREKQNNQ